MSTDIALRGSQLPAPIGQEKLQLLKKVLNLKCSDDMLLFFGEVCARVGLDPFRKQIYLVTRRDKQGNEVPAIQTGIDGFRAQAARTGEYAGQDLPTHDREDADYPLWSKVTVYRFQHGQKIAYTAMARWREYFQSNNHLWKQMPYTMLDKCAEALAIRKGFPEVAGMELEGQSDDESPEFTPTPMPAVGSAAALNARIAQDKHIAELQAEGVLRAVPASEDPPLPPPPAAAPKKLDDSPAGLVQRWKTGAKAFASIGVGEPELMNLVGIDNTSQVTIAVLNKAGELYDYMVKQPKPGNTPDAG